MPSATVACGDRLDHEFLDVDRVVGVLAAIDDVHHRHRQRAGIDAADVAVEGQAIILRRCLRHRQRHAQDRVGAQPRLVRRAVQVDHHLVDLHLVGRVQAAEHVEDLAFDIGDGLSGRPCRRSAPCRRRAVPPPRARRWRRRRAPRRGPWRRCPGPRRPRSPGCRGCPGFRGRRCRRWLPWRRVLRRRYCCGADRMARRTKQARPSAGNPCPPGSARWRMPMFAPEFPPPASPKGRRRRPIAPGPRGREPSVHARPAGGLPDSTRRSATPTAARTRTWQGVIDTYVQPGGQAGQHLLTVDAGPHPAHAGRRGEGGAGRRRRASRFAPTPLVRARDLQVAGAAGPLQARLYDATSRVTRASRSSCTSTAAAG